MSFVAVAVPALIEVLSIAHGELGQSELHVSSERKVKRAEEKVIQAI